MIGAAKPRDLKDHGSLLVRRAVLRDDWIADAILDLAAGDQTEWTLEQWDTLFTDLKKSDLTVEAWLMLYT